MKKQSNIEVKLIENFEESFESTWMVPYGNLMTVLMILFLVLYGYTHMLDKKQYEEALSSMQEDVGGEKTTEKLEEILQMEKVGDMEKALEDKGLKQFVDVIINEEGMKITLRNPVLFRLGEAELGYKAKIILKDVVGFIGGTDNEVVVEGYTCNIPVSGNGKYKSNWELSSARAFSVVRYFISLGVEPAGLSAIGYGAYSPKYANDTSENRARNRRIEINVITKK